MTAPMTAGEAWVVRERYGHPVAIGADEHEAWARCENQTGLFVHQLKEKGYAAARLAAPQWVRRPEPVAGGWPCIPTNLPHISRIDGEWGFFGFHDGVEAWRSLSAEPVTGAVRLGAVIERTATVGGWTGESVAACVGQRVMTVSDEDVPSADHWKGGETADYIAKCFNNWGIVAYFILPSVEVLP